VTGTPPHRSLVELRLLEGANLYFPRPAVKLTLDLSTLLELDEDDSRTVATRLGMPASTPGAPGTGLRQRFAGRSGCPTGPGSQHSGCSGPIGRER